MPGSHLKLQLLGPVEATIDGRPVSLGPKKQRGLLAVLALHANETVSVDRLVDALWGDRPPATAQKMVQLYVSQLRRALAADSAQIVTQGRGYELRIDPTAVDVASFERLVEEAAGARAVPNEAARAALTLWQGAPLADVANEPFAAAEIRRLEELRLRAAELAIDDDLALGREQEALAKLERLIKDHPLRERLYAQRMLALYRSGRQAEALESYAAARRTLVEEAGIEPGSELRDLQARMLRQDPSLERADAAPSLPAPVPAAPHRLAPPSRVDTRRLLWAAAAIAILAGVVFGITRLLGSDHLGGLAEDSIGVIDPDDAKITTQYRLGAAPGAVAEGAGSIWVANPGEGTVSRLHPDEDRVDTLDVGQSPAALAFGGGSIWVAVADDGAIAQIDPDANRVVQRIAVGNGASAVAVGYGAIWVATALDGEVVRVDLGSGRVTKRVAVGGRPVALAIGAGGVWVASEESGTVARIDPGTGEVLDSIAVGNGVAAVAVGLGAVWTANRDDGTVSRIDPAASRVTNTVPAGREPAALAVGKDALWVADAEGALLRLDPGSGQVDARVETDSAPAGLVDFDGSIWVTTVAPPAAHRRGTLRAGMDPAELDPATGAYDPDAFLADRLAYEGLVGYRRVGGSAGARLVGELATGLPSPVDGGRRYVFQLRRGIRYSDGRPLRAADFRASVERTLVLSAEVSAGLFDSIVGVDRCLAAGPGCDLSDGVVPNEQARTVTINLRRPDPQFMEKLGFLLVAPADTPRTPLLEHPPPGTGPYRIERVVPGRSALLTRNPYFEPAQQSGRPPGFADRVEVEMGDESDQADAVERGRLDVATVFAPASGGTTALRTRLGAQVRSGAFAMTEYAWLNTSAPPFDDPRVRLALNLAVDRARVIDLTGGTESADPTCQLLPPGLPGYRPNCPFTVAPSPAGVWTGPDPARARRLVARSGARGTPIEVWTWPDRGSVGRYLAEVLNDLGFPTHVRVFEDLGQEIEAVQRPGEHPQIGLNGWIADSPDSATFLRTLIGCKGGFNLSSFCDPRIDEAIDRAEAAGAEGNSAWPRIEREVAERAPLVPLTTRRYVVVTSDRAGNVQFHPFYGVLLDQVWVE
jgi:peptide/nickel transport system substrate-binding protein